MSLVARGVSMEGRAWTVVGRRAGSGRAAAGYRMRRPFAGWFGGLVGRGRGLGVRWDSGGHAEMRR